MSLQHNIEEYNKQQIDTVPTDILEALARNASLTQQEIVRKEMCQNALTIGDIFPDFNLSTSEGSLCSLDSLLNTGPVIINFYRGGWCPYCLLELKALNDIVTKLPQLNATLVAISPELALHATETKQQNHLNFNLLRDNASELAKRCGLVYTLTEELTAQYIKFGLDIKARHDTEVHQLTIPATYILDQHGIVRYAFVEEDFMTRAEPDEMIKVLAGLSS